MEKKFIQRPKAYRFKRFARKAYSAFNSMHKQVNIGVATAFVLISTQTTEAKAQNGEVSHKDSISVHELDEVMVTASKIEMPAEQTARFVTVITKEQIEHAPVKSIQDLLVYSANVDVVQRGAHGVQADISLRGGSSDQTAILLNGINISNPQTGHYSLDIPVNLSDIERIEILHGPAALVYGASAFSGGINIITKKTYDYKTYLSVEGGMHDLWGLEARALAKTGKAIHSLSIGYASSDGYITDSNYGLRNFFWQTDFNPDKNSKINFNLGYNKKDYGANTFYSAQYPDQYERTSSYLSSLKGEFGSKLKFVPIFYWNKHIDQFDLIKNTPTGQNFHDENTYGTNMIFQYSSRLGVSSLGGELRREEILSSVLGKPMAEARGHYTHSDGRNNTSLSFEHTAQVKKFTLSGGILINHNTMERNNYGFYPSLSLSYRLNHLSDFSASFNQSVRMPTFTELYYTTITHDGNSQLKPEKSQAAEIGYKYENSLLSAYAHGFLMWGRNIIDWVKEANGKYASWNHTKVNTQGFDIGMKLKLFKLLETLGKESNISVDYTYMNQNAGTENMISLFRLLYLKNKFTIHFYHKVFSENLYAGWFFRFQKRMGTHDTYAMENGSIVDTGVAGFPAYSTLDMKFEYRLKRLSFFTDLDNLYNTHYYDIGALPQPGFWFSGGVSYILK